MAPRRICRLAAGKSEAGRSDSLATRESIERAVTLCLVLVQVQSRAWAAMEGSVFWPLVLSVPVFFHLATPDNAATSPAFDRQEARKPDENFRAQSLVAQV